MKPFRFCGTLAVVLLTAAVGPPGAAVSGQPARPAPVPGDAATKKDSYYYYGPNGLSKYWHAADNPEAAAQRLGRDTWIHWTWGNQKVLRQASVLAGNLPVPISIDFFRLLDSRKRRTRFRDLGLMNEPNCEPRTTPDQYGLYLDQWNGDPLGYYPGDPAYQRKYPYPAGQRPVDTRHFGRPSGVVGLRLFDNPRFDHAAKAKWDVAEYFKNPGKMEPPYLVGFSCAFCHIAFDPNHPPKDPESPRWDNLAANIGNQYFREGEIFLGKGRVVFGDKNPVPGPPADPFRTRGLTDADFLYHYAVTQQPGTSETSRLSYDFINNPNTIPPIAGLRYRPTFKERTPWGVRREVMHILKDGADAVGVEWALMRVPINIGCEGNYWIDHLFNPLSGRRQRPFHIAEVLAGLTASERKAVKEASGLKIPELPPARRAELQSRYASPYGNEPFGHDWQEAWRRIPALLAYLKSYGPSRLVDAKKSDNPADARAARAALAGDEGARLRRRGAVVFGAHCARCHSSKRPAPERPKEEWPAFFRWSATAPLFLEQNYLSDEARYPVTALGTNMARALATNAVDGDIWAEFSSREYKALPPLGPVRLAVPVFRPDDATLPWFWRVPIPVEFEPPGGGRGYYRTPSLLSLWATAPYLHNNSVGDYYVTFDDGTRGWVSADGAYQRPNGSNGWKWRGTTPVNYRIDPSVNGRLLMFADGMDKLLNPARRHRWVKRTTHESTLVPDLEGSTRQLAASVVRDVLRQELLLGLQASAAPAGYAAEVLKAVEAAAERPLQDLVRKGADNLQAQHKQVQEDARALANGLFDGILDNLSPELKNRHLDLVPEKALKKQLNDTLRPQLEARMKQLSADLYRAARLSVPAGTPVNLYANLSPLAKAHAAVAHLRHRDDPHALAAALLQMSDCPDLVEDSGHVYGADLSDQDKKALIEFLKTF